MKEYRDFFKHLAFLQKEVEDKYVYQKQLKEMLGIGITLAYRLVKNNTIQALKVGREYKIPKRNVIAYLTNQNEI